MELRKHGSATHLPLYKNENALPMLISKVKSSSAVQKAWRDLIGDTIDTELLSEALLDDTLQVWCFMRIRQAVQQYIFQKKQKGNSSIGHKGTPALKKTLDKFYYT